MWKENKRIGIANQKRLACYHSFLADTKKYLFQYERKFGRTRNIVTIA